MNYRVFVALARPTLSVDRLLGYRSRRPKCYATAWKWVETKSRPTFRQSHGTPRVANEWPIAARRTASVAQLQQTHGSDHSWMQRIRRRAVTYLEVATPTRCPFCFLQRRLWASGRYAASRNGTVDTRIGTACSPRDMVVTGMGVSLNHGDRGTSSQNLEWGMLVQIALQIFKNTIQNLPKHAISSEKFIFFCEGPSPLLRPLPRWIHSTLATKPSGSSASATS